ncbi:alpha/beta hydrolase family protein [Flavobacterium sp. ZS1P14]|uniref:alpha/beta hydrolase n=1 Tax=Flavobacterium sp. ZS1P14 TaxID=3401729 RepID=UPI003AAB2351
MKRIIMHLMLLLSISLCAQDISGKWSGIIDSRKSIPVVFNFTFEKTGENYTTIIDIPALRVAALKPKGTIFSKGTLLVDGSNLGFRFDGIFNQNAQQIEGTFTEGVNTLPLVLKNAAIKTENTFKRPQEPVKPYPYKEEEITFSNKNAGLTLAGTLSVPNQTGKFQVVILISGSGPQDRDETFYEHKPFLVLADYLTRQGIAVLRFDDRGAGKSNGDHSSATTKDLATDVMSAVEYLKSRKDIDKNKIGLIGHSEGAIIAPMVANLDKMISFIVMLGGSGIPGSEISLYLAKKNRGFPVPDEAAYEVAIKKAIKIAAADKDLTEIKKELKMHYNEAIVPMLKPIINSDAKIEEIIANLIEIRTSAWNRYFYNYNPANELEKVTCPVLALNGSKDMQAQSKINQEGIRSALTKGRNNDFLVKELPDLNHLLQECGTGEMNEYSTIEQTIAPMALKQISDWVLIHNK